MSCNEIFGNVMSALFGVFITFLATLGLIVNRHFWEKEEGEKASKFKNVNMFINIGFIVGGFIITMMGIAFELNSRKGIALV
jgi:hypothetical protein